MDGNIINKPDKNEYDIAMKKEEQYYDIIKNYFNYDNLIRTNKFHKFDYIHKNNNKGGGNDNYRYSPASKSALHWIKRRATSSWPVVAVT